MKKTEQENRATFIQDVLWEMKDRYATDYT